MDPINIPPMLVYIHIYTIHGSYGYWISCKFFFPLRSPPGPARAPAPAVHLPAPKFPRRRATSWRRGRFFGDFRGVKSPFFMGKSTINGQFSSIFNSFLYVYQRLPEPYSLEHDDKIIRHNVNITWNDYLCRTVLRIMMSLICLICLMLKNVLRAGWVMRLPFYDYVAAILEQTIGHIIWDAAGMGLGESKVQRLGRLSNVLSVQQCSAWRLNMP